MRRFPPRRLPVLTDRQQALASALWLLLLAASIVACSISVWHAWHQTYRINQPLAAVGIAQSINIEQEVAVTDPLLMEGATDADWDAGVPEFSKVTAVDGRRLPPGASLETVADALKGKPGRVAVTFTEKDGKTVIVNLRRGADIAMRSNDGESHDFNFVTDVGGRAVTGIALLICALLLFVRRRGEPVALLISLGLLGGMSYMITGDLVDWLGWWIMDGVTDVLFYLPLIVALPAFPTGEYRSNVAGWFAVVAGAVVVVAALSMDQADLRKYIIFSLLLVAAIFSLARFRRTPPGIERQQLKWAGVGVASAALILSLAYAIIGAVDQELVPRQMYSVTTTIYLMLSYLGYIALAVGLTVALLRLALWDADRAIGRSAVVGTLTLALGGLWAAVSIFSNDLMAAIFGQTNKGAVAAGSAVVAAAIIGPARGKVTAWIDRRFQAGVLALKAVPDQIRAWQASDMPGDVGRRVITTITGKLGAESAALAVFEHGAYRTVAAQGVEAADVDRWLGTLGDGTIAPTVFDDSLFAYRFPLVDAGTPVGLLLVARGKGGVGMASDEIAAIKGLATPLGAALRLACRRQARDRRQDEVMAAIERRMVSLEGASPPLRAAAVRVDDAGHGEHRVALG